MVGWVGSPEINVPFDTATGDGKRRPSSQWPSEPPSAEDYSGLSPSYFISSTGNDSNAGTTEGAAFATPSKAIPLLGDGGVLGVADDMVIDISMTDMENNPGILANHKVIVGKTLPITITGTMTGGSELNSAYYEVRNIQFQQSTTQNDIPSNWVKFLACGFFGGPTSGNTSGVITHSNKLFENCWFGGNGGRYCAISFQAVNVLYRRCVARSEFNIWTWNGSDPTAPFQAYSSVGVHYQQCVAVDCLDQSGGSAGFIGGFANTSNTTDSDDIVWDECIAKRVQQEEGVSQIGFKVEGTQDTTNPTQANNCFSIDNQYGIVVQGNGIVATVDGGQFSDSELFAYAAFSSGALTYSNANAYNNGSGVSQGATNGGGNSEDAYNLSNELEALDIIGVSGTYKGETGWDTVQTGESLFPFQNEDVIRTQYSTIDTRGFCAFGKTLSSYLKEAV